MSIQAKQDTKYNVYPENITKRTLTIQGIRNTALSPVVFFCGSLVSLTSLVTLFRVVETLVFVNMFSFQHQESGPLVRNRGFSRSCTGSKGKCCQERKNDDNPSFHDFMV